MVTVILAVGIFSDKIKTTTEEAASQQQESRQPAAQYDYDNTNSAKLDGAMAYGKNMLLEGAYGGVEVYPTTQRRYIKVFTDDGFWLVYFNESQKRQIATLQNNQSINLVCRIVDLAMIPSCNLVDFVK